MEAIERSAITLRTGNIDDAVLGISDHGRGRGDGRAAQAAVKLIERAVEGAGGDFENESICGRWVSAVQSDDEIGVLAPGDSLGLSFEDCSR